MKSQKKSMNKKSMNKKSMNKKPKNHKYTIKKQYIRGGAGKPDKVLFTEFIKEYIREHPQTAPIDDATLNKMTDEELKQKFVSLFSNKHDMDEMVKRIQSIITMVVDYFRNDIPIHDKVIIQLKRRGYNKKPYVDVVHESNGQSILEDIYKVNDMFDTMTKESKNESKPREKILHEMVIDVNRVLKNSNAGSMQVTTNTSPPPPITANTGSQSPVPPITANTGSQSPVVSTNTSSQSPVVSTNTSSQSPVVSTNTGSKSWFPTLPNLGLPKFNIPSLFTKPPTAVIPNP